jgi:hypothetical protein
MLFPPYVLDDLYTMTDDVEVFGGNTGNHERSLTLNASYMDLKTSTVTADFTRTFGENTIKSIVIGRIHSDRNAHFVIHMYPELRNAVWGSLNFLAPYMVEHKETGSYLWKYVSGTLYQFDLTKYSVSVLKTIDKTTCGVSVLGGGVAVTRGITGSESTIGFRAAYASYVDTTITDRLYYTLDFYTAVTTNNVAIPFSMTAGAIAGGATLATIVYPVIVYLPHEDKMQVFRTVSYGDHGEDGFGCNVQVATFSGISTPASMTFEVDDLGVLPYGIGNFTATPSEASTISGYFDVDEELYYLPYVLRVVNGVVKTVAYSSFTPGIVYDRDFGVSGKSFVLRAYPDNKQTRAYPIVKVGDEIRQVHANGYETTDPTISGFSYALFTDVFSAINLPETVFKPADKILHIIYKYKLE